MKIPKSPLLSYQSSQKSFVPVATGSLCGRCPPKSETLYTMAHHRVAPSQFRPKNTKKKDTHNILKRDSVATVNQRPASCCHCISSACAKMNPVSFVQKKIAPSSATTCKITATSSLDQVAQKKLPSSQPLHVHKTPNNLVLASQTRMSSSVTVLASNTPESRKEPHDHHGSSWTTRTIFHHFHHHHHQARSNKGTAFRRTVGAGAA